MNIRILINQISNNTEELAMVQKILQVFISLEEHQKIKYFMMEIKGTLSEHTTITQTTDKDSKLDGTLINLERETLKLQEKLVKIKEIHTFLHIKLKLMYQLLNKIKMKII
ncbi:unnamed protein product [Paramecium primaurelia]|uniref:Uncharacterized protein n=1 Tax=Paramecium primaurelia TaxID=5886 RepID=A0A8S1PZP5_PARPR|nr:unnamed protein product [Paramecium primaurelia]